MPGVGRVRAQADHGRGRHLRVPAGARPRRQPGRGAAVAASTTRPERRPRLPCQPTSSRLVVLAGPTAVGKGTVAAYVRTHFPRRLALGLDDHPHAAPRRGRRRALPLRRRRRVRPAASRRGSSSSGPSCTAAAKYGTPRGPVERALAEGRKALLEIDLQGARQVRERMPEALFVFLAPPSWDELVRRLVGRGTETEEERERAPRHRPGRAGRPARSSTWSSSTTMFGGPAKNSYH